MTAYRVAAVMENLPPTQDFVLDLARLGGIPAPLELKLTLVLEEVIVNVVNHAYAGTDGDMEVECATRSGSFCCTVRDWGPPFNPLETDEPDTTSGIEDRPVGGLGLMLVTTMSDDCSYTHSGEANELTFCFKY